MKKDKKIISEDDLKKILSQNMINQLLLKDISLYPLVYYFMRSFITNEAYRIECSLVENSLSSSKSFSYKSKSNKEFLHRCFFYIKSCFKNTDNNFSDGPNVLFISRDRFSNQKISTGDVIKSDYLFGSIIHSMKYIDHKYVLSLINLNFNKMPSIDDISAYSVIQFNNVSTFLKAIFFTGSLYLKWKSVKKDFINFMNFNGFNFVTPFFNKFFSFKSLFYFVLLDYTLKNALNIINPKIIVSNDDLMSIKPRVNKNMKLILVQSASVDETIEQYRNFFVTQFKSLYLQIPDYFLASGEKFAKIKKNTNASKNVIVTGQPRYDILRYLPKFYDKEKCISNLGINPGDRIVLWTTQCHGMNIQENIDNFNTVCKTIKNFDHLKLIIKQHPEESTLYSEMIYEYLYKYNLNALVPDKSYDTYELLFICDLMITKDSTTAIEAISLNKPVIILNLSGNPDRMDYVEKGVALGVYNENDLQSSIESLLKNDDELSEKRKMYITENLYFIDGKSTERVLKIIGSVIEE